MNDNDRPRSARQLQKRATRGPFSSDVRTPPRRIPYSWESPPAPSDPTPHFGRVKYLTWLGYIIFLSGVSFTLVYVSSAISSAQGPYGTAYLDTGVIGWGLIMTVFGLVVCLIGWAYSSG